MKARVHIMPKQGVLDPEGKAIAGALARLGFSGIEDVRKGKIVEIELEPGTDEDTARASLRDMCEKLLANTVIESYRIELEA